MKKCFALLTAALLALAGSTACAEGFRAAEGNELNFGALLADLVFAYETPSEDDARKIDADLSAIRALSETDYDIADAIASTWRRVYLDPDYPLYMHSGGERAVELEQASLPVGEKHAIVVLGYELKDGEMTEELMKRCDAAAAAARSIPGAILVCSGGPTGQNNPGRHTEAGLMKAYLVERCGIDASRIFIDEKAMTTVDNAVNTFGILREQGVDAITVVTSSYHQRRGQVIYSAVGAIYRLETGYGVASVGNYCYETEPSGSVYMKEDYIAALQLSQLLNLPEEALKGFKRK